VSAHGDASIDISLPSAPAVPSSAASAPSAAAAPAVPSTPSGPAGPSNRGTSKSTAARTPDPVGELHFRVSLGDVAGKQIGWFTECSGLVVEWDVFTYEEGGLNDHAHKFRGRAKHQNLVLKRGVTYEDNLLAWFLQCQDHAERKDISVELLGPDGKTVRSWQFLAAFPVKWQGPALNAASANAATETLEIAHHGFKESS
jgi:phage tail-like protein